MIVGWICVEHIHFKERMEYGEQRLKTISRLARGEEEWHSHGLIGCTIIYGIYPSCFEVVVVTIVEREKY